MPLLKRKKLFVDPQVQGALLLRAFLYWLICVSLMTAMLACWQIFSGPAQRLPDLFAALWYQYAPALVVSILVTVPSTTSVLACRERIPRIGAAMSAGDSAAVAT